MHCAGFTSDTYDRYVLGLLEEPDRSQLESQIQEQCPACLTGVQRSMNLWLVFAETLENAEPSEDFRGRIVRIAELSRKVLTFPKNSSVSGRPAVLTSTLLVICAVTSAMLVATWYAGRASSRIDTQPTSADIERLAQELATNEVKLQQETEKRKQIENELGSSGRTAVVRTKQLEDNLTKAQADIEQFKAQNERAKQNTTVLTLFKHPGARLLTMKATEAGEKALAYILFAEKARLVFVASDLPKPSAEHTYQLWILRKEDPKVVSAGLFGPADTPVYYDQAPLLTSVVGFTVTEEPTPEGSSTPSASKILEVSAVDEN